MAQIMKPAMEISNEQKANELAILYTRYVNDDGVEVYNVFTEAALLDMAQWKDEQFEKEKQELIEKAYNFIKDKSYGYLIESFGDIDLDRLKLAEDLKKTLEEQL